MENHSRRDVMQLAAAGALAGAMGATTAQAQPVAGPVIDANMHWLPETLFTDERLLSAFVGSVPREYGIRAGVAPVPGKPLRQIVIEQPPGYEVLNYAENQYSADGQIADMDQARIDKAILRLPCWQEWLGLEACKTVNDGLARHVKRNPGRFQALAVVPPWGSKDALAEAERCIKDLGFCGVQMAAHYGQLYLDEDEFRPYFKFLAGLGVPVVVHHTPMPVDYGSIVKYPNLRRQFGRCIAQGTAVGRELFSPLFEEFPNLRLVHSMLGGGFFAFADMLAPPSTGKDAVDRFEDQSAKIRRYLANNIFFDLSGAPQWGKAQLECAVKVFGADHILYGGSYPIRRDWFQDGAAYVRSLAISEPDKALILGGNAKRLFKLG
ncbi:MAG: amidohydrolase family protein [Rhodoplanes sp.]|uniref:amidohydrolase family protein n=1 Tax=Rhodoplanes sp. TaxID=1968906 RepID=UPI00184CBED2|nr:amidohydrolase family protein [Rhodoplanes sp.]NVO14868.1 amidohydrolase family protein [Rhodoplanes sp.]